MKYTLGLDIGTNSIGWAVLKLNDDGQPSNIENLGSRIFTDGRNPKDQTTLASSRRLKRQERRRRDRLAQRKKLVLNQLVQMGLFPKDPTEAQNLKKLNVLSLRSQAVEKKLANYELGRVFYNINLRRGFKSNRKGGNAEDAKNKITERITKLKHEMEAGHFKTVGQYLNDRYSKGLSTKATIENDFHLLRQLIEEEFDKIVERQKKYHSSILDGQWQTLRNRIFYQRPLKPVETGPCAIFENESRSYKFLPSYEYYRFFTELFNLSFQDSQFNTHSLNFEQILQVFETFKNQKGVSFNQIKKMLHLEGTEFSIEKHRSESKIKIGSTNSFFLSIVKEWNDFPLDKKDRISKILFSEDAVEKIEADLRGAGLTNEQIAELLAADLPPFSDVTCSFSEKGLQQIIEHIFLERRHPSLIVSALIANETPDMKLQDKLGYYGAYLPESMQPMPEHIKEGSSSLDPNEKKFGRISNPTVHAALNQLRLVVNELIQCYGKPDKIHVEFARDLKLSKGEKDELRKLQKKNEDRNAKVFEFITKHKQKISAFNIERVKLWYELEAMNNQFCVYSGKPISARMVLTDEVQVDHILPFSKSLDDGINNKVLVMASENLRKNNLTPFEAFKSSPQKWAEIQERAAKLPFAKQWRFGENAISKFEENDNFLQRHLNDTRYISKIAKKYLSAIIEQNHIVVTKGQMTSLIRGKLGLASLINHKDGSKNRFDHRHHAIDALVVALTSRRYLQQISAASASSSNKGRLRKISVEQPWEGFIENVKEIYDGIVVSHKMDHDKNGPFLEDSALSRVKNPTPAQLKYGQLFTKRVNISALPGKIGKIRDLTLKAIAEKKGLDKLPIEIKRLRIYEVSKEKPEVIGSVESGIARIVHGSQAQHEKFYQKGEVNYLAIWHLPASITLNQDKNKKRKSAYIFTCIKTFDLNTRSLNELKPHPAAKLVAKIYKNDSVALVKKKTTEIFTVKSIVPSGKKMRFLKNTLAEKLNPGDDFTLAFSKFQQHQFRKVRVSSAGRIIDNGPILI